MNIAKEQLVRMASEFLGMKGLKEELYDKVDLSFFKNDVILENLLRAIKIHNKDAMYEDCLRKVLQGGKERLSPVYIFDFITASKEAKIDAACMLLEEMDKFEKMMKRE